MSILFAAEAAHLPTWGEWVHFIGGTVFGAIVVLIIGLAIAAHFERKWYYEKQELERRVRDAEKAAERLREEAARSAPQRAALKDRLAKLLRERELAREELYKLGLEENALEAKLEMIEERYVGPINDLYEKL